MIQQTYKITTMSIQRCHNVAHDIYAMLCVFWDKKKQQQKKKKKNYWMGF